MAVEGKLAFRAENRQTARPTYLRQVMSGFCFFVVSVAIASALIMLAPAFGQTTCTMAVTPVLFGTYIPGSPAPLDSNGDVEVRCDAGQGKGKGKQFYTIRMNGGNSGDPATRYLNQAPIERLFYNLYKDVGRTDVWGDGSSATPLVARIGGGKGKGKGKGGNTVIQNHPIYGRCEALQDIPPGSYTDVVSVTIEF